MIKKRVEGLIEKTFGQSITLLTPKDASQGDYAIHSRQIQAEIPTVDEVAFLEKLKESSIIQSIEKVGDFINLRVSTKVLMSELAQIIQSEATYEFSENKAKKVIVEYSSPNIAKPFTIGHLRSTIIGNAIANLLEATDHTVYRDNHVGDWGTQFGKQIYAIKKWGDEEAIASSERPVKALVDLYVKFHEEAEIDPSLEDEAREWFMKLEAGDSEAKRLWKRCVDWSWTEFDSIYKKLNITFTENNGRGYGESYFEDKMAPIISELQEKGLLQDNEGAKLVYFSDEKVPPLMIVKRDGATLYSTRDLTTDKFRLDTYGQDVTIINEVGAEQSLYFQQLFLVEEMAGWVKMNQRIHVKHGMYRFKEGKMSTRKGNAIWLEDVLEEAIRRARKLTSDETINVDYESKDVVEQRSESNKKNRFDHKLSSEEVDDISQKIGIGALKWNDLKRNIEQDVVFDWDEMLNMRGNSGPYIQYTYARCMSIKEKSSSSTKDSLTQLALGEATTEEELSLLRFLPHFPDVIESAAKTYSPHFVCTYLYELAQKFNVFYEKNPILKSEGEVLALRLALVEATSLVLKKGLYLLGIDVVEKI